jgi:Ni2+-binding GTPase involved in maturation of urease and hydrogenase
MQTYTKNLYKLKNEYQAFWNGYNVKYADILVFKYFHIFNNYTGKKFSIDFIEEKKKVDKTIYVDRYTIEKREEIFNYFDENDRIILNAPTGSGKSTIITEYCNSNDDKICVITAPTNNLCNQIVNKNDEYCLVDQNNHYISGFKVYVSTYASLHKIPNIDYLFIDEGHDLVSSASFKSNKTLQYVLDTMNRVKKSIVITATDNNLLLLNDEYKRLYINVNNKLTHSFTTIKYDDNDIDAMIINELVKSKADKNILWIDNEKILNRMKEHLVAEGIKED